MMFRIGQHIMYGIRAVCKVEAIGRLDFVHGCREDYYTLRPPYTTSNERIYVPVNSTVFMRPVLTKNEVFAALRKSKGQPVKVFASKNRNLLVAHYQEMLATHDVNEHLRLFKEIYQKKLALESGGKNLMQTELRFFKQVGQLLSEEFSIALREPPERSMERLYAAALGREFSPAKKRCSA